MQLTPDQKANPLINPPKTKHDVPAFDKIEAKHFLPAIEWAIEQAHENIDAIKAEKTPDFDNTVEALELAGKQLTRILSIFGQYKSVLFEQDLDDISEEANALVNEYSSDVSFDAELFKRVKSVYDRRDKLGLDDHQRALLEETYDDYVNAGALLDDADQDRVRKINEELSNQYTNFRRNLSKVAEDFKIVIDDEADLAGVPDRIKDGFKKDAENAGHPGKWVITSKPASVGGILSYADDRDLRKKVWMFGKTKGHLPGTDNRPVVKRILELRHEKTLLLNNSRPDGQGKYRHFADYVLKDKMAGDEKSVRDMLDKMVAAAKPVAEQEHKDLEDFAARKGGPATLEQWDTAYYARRLKEETYGFDAEELRPYFPFEQVAEGVFGVAEKMYDITIKPAAGLPTYHKDATPHEVVDNKSGDVIGVLYTDFFPRPGPKKTGAWAGYYRRAHEIGGKRQLPVVGIHGNFTEPTDDAPSLLSFSEATTFIHELGHGLHNLLSEARYESQSGSNVKHDFVELPSQIMENWLKEKQVLDMFAKHHETGDKMPAKLLKKLQDSENFRSGTAFLRQLQFATLDMAFHTTDPAKIKDVVDFEAQVTAPFQLSGNPVPGTGMSTGFGHLFDGAAYAAGYYDYKWAEMLEADAFERFKSDGLFNKKTASDFRKLLAAGGTRDPMELFVEFRGRKPQIDPLLRREGLKNSPANTNRQRAAGNRRRGKAPRPGL